MSTYNEKEIHLKESIQSILNQTYNNIEFIIICDNPENKNIQKILIEYEKKDDRVKVIINEKNIGLALSLNKAIKIAKGEYLLRMDADDISLPNRIEKQLDYMENNEDCSVLGSGRVDIDENGNVIKSNNIVISNFKKIKKVLPYGSVVTHPSVIMRKSIIVNMKGYRDFKASQDYDLWLRLLSNNYKIYNLQDKLIYYRIRDKSITSENPYKQYLYSKYSRLLYNERKEKTTDSYSPKNLEKYLIDNKFSNINRCKIFNENYRKYIKGIELIKHRKYVSGGKFVFSSMINEKEIVKLFIYSVKYKFSIKYVNSI